MKDFASEHPVNVKGAKRTALNCKIFVCMTDSFFVHWHPTDVSLQNGRHSFFDAFVCTITRVTWGIIVMPFFSSKFFSTLFVSPLSSNSDPLKLGRSSLSLFLLLSFLKISLKTNTGTIALAVEYRQPLKLISLQGATQELLQNFLRLTFYFEHCLHG